MKILKLLQVHYNIWNAVYCSINYMCCLVFQDASELKNELQRKEMLIQKHLTKIHHWQQVLEDINVQHKKPTEMPQGPLAFLEQASANIPAPMKPNWSMCRDPEHYPDCVSGDTLSAPS